NPASPLLAFADGSIWSNSCSTDSFKLSIWLSGNGATPVAEPAPLDAVGDGAAFLAAFLAAFRAAFAAWRASRSTTALSPRRQGRVNVISTWRGQLNVATLKAIAAGKPLKMVCTSAGGHAGCGSLCHSSTSRCRVRAGRGLAQSILEEQFDRGHVAGLGLFNQLVGDFLEVLRGGAVQKGLAQGRDLPGKRIPRSSLVAFGKATVRLAFVR